MPPRMTFETRRVLSAMLDDPGRDHYGLELAKAAGLKSGTLYPILSRLEAAGWIEGSWEDIDPHVEGRRLRRYYKLTPTGTFAAERSRRELEELAGKGSTATRPAAPRLRPS